MAISGEGGVKRTREEGAIEGERVQKRVRLEGVAAVHELIAMSEEAFFAKSASDIATVMTNFLHDIESGSLAQSPIDKIQLIRREIHLIEDRITRNINIDQQEKEQLFKQIKEILPLLKTDKKSELPEAIAKRVPPTAATIAYLWNVKDIQVTENGELRFSDAIAQDVNNEFLKKVFTQSVDVDFFRVEFFNLLLYPKLDAQSPALIYTYCPQIFDHIFGQVLHYKVYNALKEPQYCDHTLKVQDEEISINRWYLGRNSIFLKGAWEDFGYAEGVTVLDLPIDIDAQTVRESLDCVYNPNLAREVDQHRLGRLLRVATALDIPPLVAIVDHALSLIVDAKLKAEYRDGRATIIHGLADGISDEEAIRFIREMKDEFRVSFDSEVLPTTSESLNYIAEQVFIRACRRDANYNPFRMDTDDELATQLQMVSRVFETLGRTNILSDFSLLGRFPFPDAILSQPRSDAILTQYQLLLETCVRYNSRDKNAFAFLAFCHQWGHDPDKYVKAKHALERLMQLAPTRQTRCALALLLFTGATGVEKNPERAIQLLQYAIEDMPTAPIVYVTLAHLLKESGKVQEAISLLRKFDDGTKDYSELLPSGTDPFIIRLYSLYLRTLNGEKIDQDVVKALLETTSREELTPFGFFMVLVIAKDFPPIQPEQRVGDLLQRLWKEQFDCSLPIFKDVLKHVPQDFKDALFSGPQFQRFLS